MKRKYAKPGIYIESFMLSQTIAAGGCGAANPGAGMGVPGLNSKETCGWNMDGTTILWYEGIGTNCTTDLGDNVGGLCYNNPDGGITIFGES